MSDLAIGLAAVAFLLVMILGGIPIAYSLMIVSLLGMVLLTGDVAIAGSLLSSTALEAVRNYVFVVAPLFILMGAFISNSKVGTYLYEAAHLITRKLAGGLAIATVYANAIFAAVTGVSVASAAVFARISFPEMMRHGYSKRFALGAVAGSSVLGMLIPPSLLLIIYGVTAQVSIGALFIAGIIPGLLLATMYSLMIVIVGKVRPAIVGRLANVPRELASKTLPTAVTAAAGATEREQTGIGENAAAGTTSPGQKQRNGAAGSTELSPPLDGPATRPRTAILRFVPIALLIVGAFGGIWTGIMTPTEASAVGSLGALVIALSFRMGRKGFLSSFHETAISTGAIMILLVSAQMYSRMLASSGLVSWVTTTINNAPLAPSMLLLVFVMLLVALGAIMDSSSIIILTVPLMVPAVGLLGMDPVWFGIVMIIAVEIGLLTPPFGIVPFSMSAVLGDTATVEDVFAGALPYILVMALCLLLVMSFPGLATWLPSLM